VVLALVILDRRIVAVPWLGRIIYGLMVFVTAYTIFTLWEYLRGNKDLLLEIRRRGAS
jgi:hypothetical protein